MPLTASSAMLLCLAWLAAVPREGQADANDVAAAPAEAQAALLDDADLAVAGEAARALGEMGAAAFPAIGEILATGSTQQRWGATVALYRSTADPEPFLPQLARQLSEQDERLVLASLGVLARLQSRAGPVLPSLEALLANDEPSVRAAALATFAATGPAARGSVPALMPLLQDESGPVRLAAADAIRRVQPPVPMSADRLARYTAWLKEHVPARMRDGHVPGASIAIIQRGEVAWAQGFGVSDARTGKAVTVDTVFEAASMSKPVLALVAMQLVQEGRLDLDRPLVDYLGHDYLPDQPAHRRITARMALSHRTGFENWRAGYDEMGGPLSLQVAPGSEYTYSGEGILFLQRAVESIAGEPLDRLAQERLFGPLGLVRTSFVWTQALGADFASGHRADGSFKERTRYRRPNAAYSLYTTPAEYARLMLTLRRPELLGGRALTRECIDVMLERQLRLDDGDANPRPGLARPVAAYRALGWSLDVTPEGDIVQHSGSNSSGFKAFGQFNPAKGSGIVIFANGDGGYDLRAAVIGAIGDL
jgi:CubicO group peptidase (beta-lactamase class C family)